VGNIKTNKKKQKKDQNSHSYNRKVKPLRQRNEFQKSNKNKSTSTKFILFTKLKKQTKIVYQIVVSVFIFYLTVFKFVINGIIWLITKPIKYLNRLEIRIKPFSLKTITFAISIVILYIISILYFTTLKDIPSPNKLIYTDPRLTTTIYDRKGNILYRIYLDEDRVLAKLDEIPQDLINATISIEDQTFYQHKGLSIRGIFRASKRTLLEDDLEGGSTITQQLVKNSLLTPERTLQRKIKEALISIEVERRFTKDQILEMYLNKISYGGTAYGVKSASKKYFGKDLNDLSLAESAYLAGLPAAPSKYSPFSAGIELGKNRQHEVLNRMVSSGYITQDQMDLAYSENLNFITPTEYIKAPHFVNYIILEVEKNYGQMLVQQGGLDIYTSLDLDLQNELEKIVKVKVNGFARYNVKNGAALVTNPKTGEILAMVGSVDFWDVNNDGNFNVTTAPRQPGSSIKPLTYALALESGYTPMSIINDSPISYKISGQQDYKPVNYDGRFHGNVTLKTALANSYNVPAVKVLDKLGVSNLISFGKKLGITTWDKQNTYGLSLTLGAGEVKMTDMAVVYGTLANNGYKKELSGILKIYDSFGDIIEENTCVNFLNEMPSILTRKAIFEVKALASTSNAQAIDGISCPREKVIHDSTAYILSSILSDNRARTPAFGPNSSLNVSSKQIAVKTGTTSNLKDNWAIGYSNDYVVLAWIGNNNGEIMKNVVSGYRGATEIWRSTIDYLITTRNIQDKLTVPEDMIEVDVCDLTQTLACDLCNSGKQIFDLKSVPTVKCDNEVIRKILESKIEEEEGQEDQ